MSGPIDVNDIFFLLDNSDDDIRKGVTVAPYYNKYNKKNETRIAIWTMKILKDNTAQPMTGGGCSLTIKEFEGLHDCIAKIKEKVSIVHSKLLIENLQNCSRAEILAIRGQVDKILQDKSDSEDTDRVDAPPAKRSRK